MSKKRDKSNSMSVEEMRAWFTDMGFTRTDSKQIVEVFCARIFQYLLDDKPVHIFGVGELIPVKKASKLYYGGIVREGEDFSYMLPQRINVVFKPKRSFDLELRKKMCRLNPKEWEAYYAGVERVAIARGLRRRTKDGENIPISEILNLGGRD